MRIYKQIGFVRRETKVTATWSDMPGGNTVSKPVEGTAVHNVDIAERLQRQQELTDRAISRLSKREREIIEKRYLEDEDVYDYHVIAQVHLSESKYYRVKSNALYKLAFALALEVYVEPTE